MSIWNTAPRPIFDWADDGSVDVKSGLYRKSVRFAGQYFNPGSQVRQADNPRLEGSRFLGFLVPGQICGMVILVFEGEANYKIPVIWDGEEFLIREKSGRVEEVKFSVGQSASNAVREYKGHLPKWPIVGSRKGCGSIQNEQ